MMKTKLVRGRTALAVMVTVLTAGPWLTGVQGATRGLPNPDALPAGAPDATIDLATEEGVRMVGATWRYGDARIIEVPFRAVGADNKPSGPANTTYAIEPRAGTPQFDDSAWEVLAPTALAARKSSGRLSFAWYRIAITVPERIGAFDPTGSTAVFEITVDDYAEVWVDGELPRALGARNANLVQGWNSPNRLVIGRDVRPGQRIQLAVFAINGPLSDPPPNYIWVRGAKVEFHREPRAIEPTAVDLKVTRLDPALDEIIAADAKLEKIAEGFRFTEGPVWHSGSLLFSDPNANRIYRWSGEAGLSVFRERSGYAGADVREYRQPGSNGLAQDGAGRLTIAEHGNRRISRLDDSGTLTVLAERYRGGRLNSPNDLVYRRDGSLYFTDPPFGLPKLADDPRRELDAFGVYRLDRDGSLTLLTAELKGPNGIAFSPDERFLYVGNWDEARKVVMRYPVLGDGRIGAGEVFADLGDVAGEEAIDGVKADREGNVFVSGPGGLWIFAPDGRRLGVLQGPELAANFAWGPRGMLYLTARTGVYRLPVRTAPAVRE